MLTGSVRVTQSCSPGADWDGFGAAPCLLTIRGCPKPSLEQQGWLQQTLRWAREDGALLKDPRGRKNVVAPFILPIKKSNMAMSMMFSSRLPLL